MARFGAQDDMAYPYPMGGWGGLGTSLEGTDADARDVERFRRGDQDAFESLVARHEGEVYRVALRMLGDPEEAMDASQETFLRAYRGLKRFRGEAAFRTWLTGIAMNVCRNHLASAEHRLRKLSVPLEVQPAGGGDPVELPLPDPKASSEEVVGLRESMDALKRALLALPPEQREVVLLREVSGLDYEEMASALGCPVGTIRSRLARGREALVRMLKGIWP